MFSPRRALIVVLVVIAAGVGVWIASAAYESTTVVYTIDETDPASLPTAFPTPLATPFDDDCPVGAPCKVWSDLNVPDDGQPIPAVTSIVPTAFQGVWGTSIPNGTVVGRTHVVYYFSTGTCSASATPVANTKDFRDGGLKGEVGVPDDGSDEALQKTDKWPTKLELDLRVKYLLDHGHRLLRRSVAVLDGPILGLPKVPVNLLSFDVSDGHGFADLTYRGIYNVAVTYIPGQSQPGTCTPLTNNSLLLGEAAGNAMLRCYTPGTHTMTTVLTHESGTPPDLVLVVDKTVSDNVVCSPGEGLVGGIAENPDIAERAGGSSSLPYSALAGAAAAGAILLVGGAWYARRRRLS